MSIYVWLIWIFIVTLACWQKSPALKIFAGLLSFAIGSGWYATNPDDYRVIATAVAIFFLGGWLIFTRKYE